MNINLHCTTSAQDTSAIRRMMLLVTCLFVGSFIGMGVVGIALADDDESSNGPNGPKNTFNILMNYELGMHCTGFEFAYCCVLPPYNSILAQVVKTQRSNERQGAFAKLLEADPNVGLDGMGRPTVLRDSDLNADGNFSKYQLRYWHEAQPRNDGRGAPQDTSMNRLISSVEGNSLLMWNTVAEGATTVGGALQYSTDPAKTDGSTNVVQGDGDFADANDNYWNAVWNHLYVYDDLEGTRLCKAGMPSTTTCHEDTDCDSSPGTYDGVCGASPENKKVRLGVDLIYPENTGAAMHTMGPGAAAGIDNVLTFSGDTGTVVYTQMKVLENLPVMLTSPRIWEALGLPLTPFEDTIAFFTDPGAVDEQTIRPYVKMVAQLEEYPSGNAVLDNGQPVIGFGTAPIDIPNCERCHALGIGPVNSAQTDNPGVNAMVQAEILFWNDYYMIDTGAGDSDWYSRLKGAAISILGIHDAQHGTHFISDAYPVTGGAGMPQATRLGHGSVMCQRCHADNVIAAVKSADCGPNQNCDANHPRNELWSNITATTLIKPLSEALHNNHKDNPFNDRLGRNGGCQGCHPAHRSDGDMRNYPITETGDNAYAAGDNRDAAGGCFVGRDVHSNRNKENDGAGTPEHLNAVGQYLVENVVADTGEWKGIWCTNCHSQLGQELWKKENCESLIHGDCISNPRAEPTLADVAAAIGVSEEQAISWLDPKGSQCAGGSNQDAQCFTDADCPGSTCVSLSPDGVDHTAAIWNEDPGMCNHAASLLGLADASPYQDGNVATVEINLDGDGNCSTGYVGLPGPDCGTNPGNPSFWLCIQKDDDGDANVHLVSGGIRDSDGSYCMPTIPPELDADCVKQSPFCTTADCVGAAQALLDAPGSGAGSGAAAVPVPFSAATDGRDHWLAGGEPHCADCHAAPYVEQSGNINPYPPFNYPRKASLFRYSRGHRDITCQGCHESIHGLYPSAKAVNADGVEVVIDTTTYAQAASMNTDGSHGPLKCGACHRVNSAGVHSRMNDLRFDGQRVSNSPDAAIGWAHVFTAEHSPLDDMCQNCHGDERGDVRAREEEWQEHAMRGRASRLMMNQVEIELLGAVAGTNPATGEGDATIARSTVCRACHDDEFSEVSCRGEDGREWKRHLTEGRVAQTVWEAVARARTGTTCGW